MYIIYYNIMYLHFPLSLSLARFFLYSTRSSLTRTTMKIYEAYTVHTHSRTGYIIQWGHFAASAAVVHQFGTSGGEDISNLWVTPVGFHRNGGARGRSPKWEHENASPSPPRQRVPINPAPRHPARPSYTHPRYIILLHSPDPLINDFTLVSTAAARAARNPLRQYTAHTHTHAQPRTLTLWPPTGCFNDRNLNLH